MVVDAFYTFLRNLRDVHQTIFAGQNGDKGAEVNDLGHFAFVNLTNFRFCANSLHHFQRCIS